MIELLNKIDWALAASVSTTLVGIIALIAAFIGLTQLKEMSRFRHLDAMLRIYELIGNETSREDRRMLYNGIGELNPNESISDEQRKRIERVSTTFDRIGKLVKSNLVPKEEFLESNCEVVIRTWCVLEHYLSNHADKIGGRHCAHFKYLNDLATKYHCNKFPNDILRIVNCNEDAVIEIIKNGKSKKILRKPNLEEGSE